MYHLQYIGTLFVDLIPYYEIYIYILYEGSTCQIWSVDMNGLLLYIVLLDPSYVNLKVTLLQWKAVY